MQRRSFFSRIGSMVAIVALAPELAFRTRLLPLPGYPVIVGHDPGPKIYSCVIENLPKCYILHSEPFREEIITADAFYENFSLPESDLNTMHNI